MKEWQDKFNSFNSYKGLMYKQWYDAILAGKFLPPIEASVDPANMCNLDCVWCNGRNVKDRNHLMTTAHLLELVKFFTEWGVKAVCFAGGGEPTLQPHLYEAIDLCGESQLPVAVITNGTRVRAALLESMAVNCRWVGVSVDAATSKTYEKLKKSDVFDDVTNNIKRLIVAGCREVTFKFLLHPENQHEVYRAILLARDLGCHRIHIRPVSFMNFQDHEDKYDLNSINEQVFRGRELFESDRFKVFYVQHKFDKDLHRQFNFKKCLATPIMPIFNANGDISICIDRKGDDRLVIGSHEDVSKIPEIWGSKKHKEVIRNINLNDCPKCTIQHCNEFIEKAVIENSFDWQFT